MSEIETIEDLRNSLNVRVDWAPGYEGSYAVTEDGRVFSFKEWCGSSFREKSQKTHNGYRLVGFGSSVNRAVHRVVLETFVGPCPEGQECRHLDGDKHNNHLDNLKWGTRSENILDRVEHGTHNRGSNCGTSKLSEEDVRRIVDLLQTTNKSHREIANDFPVTRTTVSNINTGKRWKHFTSQFIDDYPIRR